MWKLPCCPIVLSIYFSECISFGKLQTRIEIENVPKVQRNEKVTSEPTAYFKIYIAVWGRFAPLSEAILELDF